MIPKLWPTSTSCHVTNSSFRSVSKIKRYATGSGPAHKQIAVIWIHSDGSDFPVAQTFSVTWCLNSDPDTKYFVLWYKVQLIGGRRGIRTAAHALPLVFKLEADTFLCNLSVLIEGIRIMDYIILAETLPLQFHFICKPSLKNVSESKENLNSSKRDRGVCEKCWSINGGKIKLHNLFSGFEKDDLKT